MQLKDVCQIVTKDTRLLLYESFLRKLLVKENIGICTLCPAELTCVRRKHRQPSNFTACCIEFQRWQMDPKEKDPAETNRRLRRANLISNEINDLLEEFFR